MGELGFCEGCQQEKEICAYDIGGFPYCFGCWEEIQTELGGYDDDIEENYTETAEDWSEEQLKRRG